MTVRGLTNPEPGTSQTIDFGSLLNEENNCVAVSSSDVRIISSPGDHVTGSSKVRMNNVVDYTWEEKFYPGQLLAVHMSGKYIAYGIKPGSQAVSVIRVVNRETAKRALIKGIEGTIEDLAFAYIPDRMVLASLDFGGKLLVYDIVENAKGDITCQLLLSTTGDQGQDEANPKRVFWCPYVPDDYEVSKDEESDDGFLLAVARGNKVELWNVGVVSKRFGPGPHAPNTISDGYLEIEASSSSVISDAAFSPDGTAFATASYDGRCKFYQVYMVGDGEPRLLHEWEPHNGDPVNTLFFLDDHVTAPNEIQFWKYAVTAAKDNCEIKLWSCQTWECHQKISLTTRSSRHSRGWGKLKAAVDLSAGYILLSDMYLRLLYVLELRKDSDNVTQPFVQTITEFKLPYPILSFGIVDAGLKVFNKNSGFGIDDVCNGDSEDDTHSAVVVRMYLVQPKSLQECHIVFQSSNAIEVHHNAIHNAPITIAEKPEFKKEVDEEGETQAPILMTPDAFHSLHQTPGAQVYQKTTPPPPPPPPAPEPEELPQPNTTMVTHTEPSVKTTTGGGFISGGSSPSREVQEILSSPRLYSKPTSTTCLQGFAMEEISDEKVKTLESGIHSLKSDVAGLMELAAQQALELKNLREEMKRSEAQKVSEIVDLAVSKAISASQQKATANQELLVNRLSANINREICQALSTTVAEQFKNEVNPGIARAIEQMKTLIHNEVSHKLTLTDQALKENLGKVLRSKNMIDTLCHNLNSTASAALEEISKETYTKISVPIFEKAANAMFQQMNATFSEGLHECKKELESYALKSNERTNMEINALQNAVDIVGMTMKQFSMTVEKETKRLDEAVAEMGRNLNRISMNNGSMRSGSVTPAGHLVDSQLLFQAQLDQFISEGQVDRAFQQALSASDLNLVLYVCDKVGSQQVFHGPNGCLLHQHVLLSLIQQLSADMTRHTENNQKYLEEAIMCLDANNTDCRRYMPGVITALSKKLQQYIVMNPSGRLTGRVKMLQMATQSLMTKQQ